MNQNSILFLNVLVRPKPLQICFCRCFCQMPVYIWIKLNLLKIMLVLWTDWYLSKGVDFARGQILLQNSSPALYFRGGGGFCSAAVPVPKPGSPFWQKAIILLLIPGDSFSQNVGLNKYPSNKMLPNTQVFTFDIDFNYILALWTSTNRPMLFLGLIFQHSNTPSYIYLDIRLLKYP